MSHYRHAAAIAARQSGNGADQSGFAGTIGTEQSEKLPLLNPQADAVERLQRTESLLEIAYFDGGSHGFYRKRVA